MIRSLLFSFLLLGMSFSLFARCVYVSSQSEYLSVVDKVHRGDSICWKNGIYSDVQIDFVRNSIVVCAETSGKVIFNGSSNFKIKADSLTFSGFQFVDGQIQNDVLSVSGSYNLIENLNFSNYHSRYYLNVLSGSVHNIISKCNFERKPEDIQSSVVQIQVSDSLPGYHIVRWCSFKNHTAPAGSGGDYGIEALRIGYSYQAKFVSRTLVEYCYFTHCNGDGEVVSSKARENVYRYNTFADNGDSHFTLRHGSDNVVYGNFFTGGAGLRIKEGQHQMVYNNYFNTGKYFAIQLVNYNADPLENIVCVHNTFVNSGTLMLGGTGSFPPKGIVFSDNLFVQPSGEPVSDPTGMEQFLHNGIDADENFILPGDFFYLKAYLQKNEAGFYQPGNKSKAIKSSGVEYVKVFDVPVLDDDPELKLDILKQLRPTKRTHQSMGCSEYSARVMLHPYANADNTGPDYLH